MQHDAAIERLTSALQPTVRAFLHTHPGLFVTGGFIRDVLIGVAPKDIDIVTVGERKFDFDHLQALAPQAKVIVTERAHTLHWGPDGVNQVAPPVQVIKHSWPTIEAVFDCFDWTVCRAALGWVETGWTLVVGACFWDDLIGRRLRFCAKPSAEKFGGAAGSMYRLERFLARGHGWHVCATDLAEMTRVRLTELGISEANTIANAWLRAPGQKDVSRGSSA